MVFEKSEGSITSPVGKNHSGNEDSETLFSKQLENFMFLSSRFHHFSLWYLDVCCFGLNWTIQTLFRTYQPVLVGHCHHNNGWIGRLPSKEYIWLHHGGRYCNYWPVVDTNTDCHSILPNFNILYMLCEQKEIHFSQEKGDR